MNEPSGLPTHISENGKLKMKSVRVTAPQSRPCWHNSVMWASRHDVWAMQWNEAWRQFGEDLCLQAEHQSWVCHRGAQAGGPSPDGSVCAS